MKATGCSPKRILSLEVRQDPWYHFVSSDARFYSRHPLCCFFWTVHLLSESLSRRFKIQHPPPPPTPFMNNNSRPENHLRSLSATFVAFHISTRAALRHRPHYIVSLFCEGAHRVEYFLFGQVQLQHHLSCLSLPDAVVALWVYLKNKRRRMQNASKDMFC